MYDRRRPAHWGFNFRHCGSSTRPSDQLWPDAPLVVRAQLRRLTCDLLGQWDFNANIPTGSVSLVPPSSPTTVTASYDQVFYSDLFYGKFVGTYAPAASGTYYLVIATFDNGNAYTITVNDV